MNIDMSMCRCCLTSQGYLTEKMKLGKSKKYLFHSVKLKNIFADLQFDLQGPFLLCEDCVQLLQTAFKFKLVIAESRETFKRRTIMSNICKCCLDAYVILKSKNTPTNEQHHQCNKLENIFFAMFSGVDFPVCGNQFLLCSRCNDSLGALNTLRRNITEANVNFTYLHPYPRYSTYEESKNDEAQCALQIGEDFENGNVAIKTEFDEDNKMEVLMDILDEDIKMEVHDCDIKEEYLQPNVSSELSMQMPDMTIQSCDYIKTENCEMADFTFVVTPPMSQIEVKEESPLLDDKSSTKFVENNVSLNHIYVVKESDGFFHCNNCPAKYQMDYEIIAHMTTNQCKLKFTNPCDGSNQSSSLENNSQPSEGFPSATQDYTCQYCKVDCSESILVSEHLTKIGPINAYKCKYCEQTFRTYKSMQKHARIHEEFSRRRNKYYRCKHCNMRLKETAMKFQEIGEDSSKSKVNIISAYECDYCNSYFAKDFVKNVLIEIPSEEVDTDGEPWNKCENSTDNVGLQETDDLNETEERLCICQYCGSNFTSLADLKTHELRHEAETS